MEKPSDYENVQPITDFETLEPGAYKCKILKVEELKASNDKTYLKISFDIAEGEKTDFYKKRYQADTREDKKWGGVLTIFVLDFENKTNRYLKTLITCAEASNAKFKFDWEHPEKLKDKKIGIIFREEEFEDTFGAIKTATKPFRACVYDKTEEAKIPNKKTLPQKGEAFESTSVASDNDDLPF
ncbi:MAG: hypothetical protein ACLU84_06860 [Clostridia bacterium]